MSNAYAFAICEQRYLSDENGSEICDREFAEVESDRRADCCPEPGCEGEFLPDLKDNRFLVCSKCGSEVDVIEAVYNRRESRRDSYDDYDLDD